jgi:hypothetical protein
MWPHKKPTTSDDFDPLNLPRKLIKIAAILMLAGAVLLTIELLDLNFFHWWL